VRDKQDETRDRAIADHVMELHIKSRSSSASSGGATSFGNSGERLIELGLLKRYIAYARARCAPRLSKEGADALRDQYVTFRAASRQQSRQKGDVAPAVPITVRQVSPQLLIFIIQPGVLYKMLKFKKQQA